MTAPWFYFPLEKFEALHLELNGTEANHILGARRLHPGDELVLSNGCGTLARCLLESADKRSRQLRLEITEVLEVAPPAKQIVVASALPKGDRLSTLLDMGAQLGMTRFQPLGFERSVTRWSEKLNQRCARIVIEACKQCKSAWVPEISEFCSYSELLAARTDNRRLLLLADQQGDALPQLRGELESASDVYLLVGPEGGLSREEFELAQRYEVKRMKLAESILRIETAVVAAVAALNITGNIHDKT